MRIFYAFPLPEEVADWLYKTSLALREKLAGGKVTPKENLHITAAFVGNVNEIKYFEPNTSGGRSKQHGFDAFDLPAHTAARRGLDLQQNQGG